MNGGECAGSGTWNLATGYTLTTSSYVIVTITFDGTTETVYVNGAYDKSAAMTSSIPVSSANRIGVGWVRHDGPYMMNADVGVLMIYNRALSAAEVKDVYAVYKARFGGCICPKGYTCSSQTSNVCDICNAGYTSSGTSGSSLTCSSCGVNTYSAAGASSCTNCPVTTTSSGGASTCVCPVGSTSYGTSGSSLMCSCAPGYYSEDGLGPCMTETSRLPSGRVFHVDAGQTSSYPGSGSTWYDLSGMGNHLYWTPSTVSPLFGRFNGFTVLRTTPLQGYLRPVISTTYNGIRVSSDPYSAVGVYKVNALTAAKILLSFGPANNNCNGENVHPIATGIICATIFVEAIFLLIFT